MVRQTPLRIALMAAMFPVVPAFAQDAAPAEGLTCGGEPAQWMGGTREGSDIATAENVLGLSLTSSAEREPYAAFTITGEPIEIRLEAQSSGDPALRLETADGDVIEENDDAPGTLNSRIETRLAPGDYCARLIPVGNPDMTAQLQLSTLGMEPLLSAPQSTEIQACTPQTEATALAEGSLSGHLPVATQTEGAVTYHRFTLDEPTSLRLQAESDLLDPNMVLFEGDGRRIAQNDDTNGLNSQLDFPQGLAAGDYCIGVGPISAGVGTITVSASELNRENYLASAHRRGEVAPTIGGDYPMQQLEFPRDRETIVLQDGTAQWLSFTLDQSTMMVIHAHGTLTGVDTQLTLFGPDGAVIAQDDDGGSDTDSKLGPTLLSPGQYRIALTDVSRNGVQGSIRPVTMVFQRYLPAD
ncbi:DVUA0089 family protein [Paracoccus sp. 1_MG-2023]|uniref:DVUA0089 family protein n=1 Tax=unclassified Paracoccus (in: a-proteobacteria) TaxID=2688777 RepID=UPI001C082395|nr:MULTISPECIES: DVUA0089 family protein [unclassified Paracoccus (in: a-proteobacteria)]MBU2958071.1 DVUA0089 family protein [Paracoccus sp. C2R09]MDO6669343.1 DVUA0089 family protein [Paracoccus sp. 1_MG-2023]